ncbi:MAG: hypothetical protein PVF60_13200, partial [Desulfobacterales bacterium]
KPALNRQHLLKARTWIKTKTPDQTKMGIGFTHFDTDCPPTLSPAYCLAARRQTDLARTYNHENGFTQRL